jgi:hypothetical protein
MPELFKSMGILGQYIEPSAVIKEINALYGNEYLPKIYYLI